MRPQGLARLSTTALASLAAAFAGCQSGEPASLGQVDARIIGGAPSTSDGAVVALVTPSLRCGDAAPGTFCTGALVSPRVVLTAAHCVRERRASELRVSMGPVVAAGGSLAAVSAIEVHPQHDPAAGALDVAVIVLDRASDRAALPMARVSAEALVGGELRVVGYGVADDGTVGVARQGTVRVTSSDGSLFRYEKGSAMTCTGDSGGPVLQGDGAGGEQIVGITRSGDEGCEAFGTALSAEAFAGFVDEVIARAASVAPRPSLDAAVDHCERACEGDADCPSSMMCLNQRGVGKRCGFAALQSGRFGAACNDDLGCGVGACVAGPDDGPCRCFTPCDAPPPREAGPPVQLDLAGGCQHTAEPGDALALLAALAVARRRRLT